MGNLQDLIRALRDTGQSASNAIAGNVAGPVDLISAGLRGVGLPIPQNPVGGSQWMAEKGLTREVPMGAPRIIGETLGMAGPAVVVAKAPQIARGLLAAGDNLAAPRALGSQAGAVYGGPIANRLNAKYGDAVDAYLTEGNDVVLSKVVVPKGERNQGVGTKFMQDLVDAADEQGKRVALTPASDFGGNKSRLEQFYKRFGFVPNKGRNKDFAISESMYRRPEAPKASATTGPRQEALDTAQRNATEMLGLPPNNTPMDRAKALGYVDAYHGTADDIARIDPAKFGSSTGAQSAKRAFWAVDDPNTARGYAEYAAKDAKVKGLLDQANKAEAKGQWDKYDELLGKAEDLEAVFAKEPLQGQNVMPLMIRANKGVRGAEMNAGGAEFVDLEGGVNRFLSQAASQNRDLGVIRNLADDVGFNGRPATHFAVMNPAIVRSRFAAFDPARVKEADLLGRADPRLLGLLGAGVGGGAYLASGD